MSSEKKPKKKAAASKKQATGSSCVFEEKKGQKTVVVEKPAVKSEEEKAKIRAREEINRLRKRLRIKVENGDDVAPWASWDCINKAMSDEAAKTLLRAALETSKWYEPTAVQMQAVPTLCARRDALVCAPTGSGKTGAFLVPAVVLLKRHLPNEKQKLRPRCVIVAPTRELCAQLAREARLLTRGSDILTASVTAASDLRLDADLIVGTPLKLATLIKHGKLTLERTLLLVLDEADKLLETPPTDKRPKEEQAIPAPSAALPREPFIAQLDTILSARPIRQGDQWCTTAFFSATLRAGTRAREMAAATVDDAVGIDVGIVNQAPCEVEQSLVFVGSRDEHGKLWAVREIAKRGDLKPPAMIFVDSADRANELAAELGAELRVEQLHGKRGPAERDEVVRRFRRGDCWVLIATDLASRGLDFKAVNTVVNYDAPTQATDYLHRIGRVGRNGRGGRAITLYTEEDAPNLRAVANVAKLSGATVPAWLLDRRIKPLDNARDKRPDKQRNHKIRDNARRQNPTATSTQGDNKRKRAPIATDSKFDRDKQRRKLEAIKHSKTQHQGKKIAAASPK